MRHQMRVCLILALSVFLLTGCAVHGTEGETSEEKQPIPLTGEELAYYNEILSLSYTEEGAEGINPMCLFFMSYYDRVEEMDMASFLRYFPSSGRGAEEEFQRLKTKSGWPFSECAYLEDMPVPLHKYPAAEVERVLQQYAGIGLAELETLNGADVFYLEEYGAFYNYTSDFGLGSFVCIRGEREGDMVRLYQESWDGTWQCLTLQETEDGPRILSHRLLTEAEQ